MSYFLAPSLRTLRDQINSRWPNRDKGSDGWIGDPSHQARPSDHNPDWPDGIVRALDVDKDGIDVEVLLKAVIGERRVAYVIWNRRIWTHAKGWQPYSGPNGHTAHVHISIRHTTAAAAGGAWKLGAGAVGPVATPSTPAQPKPSAGSGSVVDWLASKGRDSSYAARARLAAQCGIKGYSGTAAQNTALLAKLKAGASAPAVKPKPAPAKPKPAARSIAQMAAEVRAGKHGNGHDVRRKSLGISAAEYAKVRAAVNGTSKSIAQMATEVIQGMHGNGHVARQKSLGVDNATYAKVRAAVNKRA
ncbi:hypothetical protein DQ353_00145 [Arthrobacter sp. AQ5-05]|uniref:hypothetical protein n=1 Tax=Arthrobacter sp. AQ5-05 TaxID=2184581 RepID=UPI000DCCB69D|nr:hypothetical protein [Arthrobacter sp. AQ5-05]RAX50848.1 hypothetical protein DQ353_00145 [Arthrobacter sp. AQ5-05]